MMKQLEKIEAAMRYVYAHFLEDDEQGINNSIESRKRVFMRARHSLRACIYNRMSCSLEMIGNAEGRIKGSKPVDHSSISKSVQKVEAGEINPNAVRQIDNLLTEFEEYWISINTPGPRKRLQKYYNMPHHVLVILISFAEEFGWADPGKLDGLHREFKTVTKSFVEDQIKKAG